jgi:heme exporter protein A
MGHIIAHLPKKLVAERLSVMRGLRCIFRGISFSVSAGEALVLTGANGVGKTTLLRAVGGFIPLADGRVQLAGMTDDSPVGDACHYVGHLNGVKRSLTVMETLRFFAAFLGGDAVRAEQAAEVLNLDGLADVPAGYLSVSLDTASQELLAGIVNAHLAGGGMVLAATHTGLGWANMTAFDLQRAIASAPADAS